MFGRLQFLHIAGFKQAMLKIYPAKCIASNYGVQQLSFIFERLAFRGTNW